jgi:RND family efflux transporter MFP subunit
MPSQKQINTPVQPCAGCNVVAPRRKLKRSWIIAAAILVMFFAGIVLFGILSRKAHTSVVRAETAQLAVPSVSVTVPERSAPAQEIVLPGDVQPFINAPIYSRTNGYLKRWYADIGTHVKKGQLLAEIETPEVDQQLLQSRSNLATAEATLKLAELTKNRYQGLLSSHAVSQQDADNAVGDYNAKKAIADAGQANVKQLEAMQSFEKIYAPFDGIITARNADIGQLISAGTAGGVKSDLFHISQPGKLRVYVNVPEQYSEATSPGLTAQIMVAEFPGRQFQGTLVRTANAINYATRTLVAEIDVNNPTGELLSGSYAQVHLKVSIKTPSYIVPVSSLIFRSQGLQVAMVKNGVVSLAPVTPGRDFGDRMEIISGLEGGETIINNPPDSIIAGEKVQVVQTVAGGGVQ